ncbi:YppG family protein [Bacillus sp. JCM 19041]|uniref:YppG family protein n=1 Tax=Bacillus sp. JCM 19041 TaxID=1460637 RepID=UPI0006D1F5BE
MFPPNRRQSHFNPQMHGRPNQPNRGHRLQAQHPQRFYHQGHQPPPAPKRRSMWAAPFTNENGNFDFSRTATSVDQFVKTVRQVSPYVAKISNFFIK